jgi:hypothetical protein
MIAVTEADIRRALDGTFTRVNVHGEFRTLVVPLDYIPNHAPRVLPVGHGKRGVGAAKYRMWSPEKEAELVALRWIGWSQRRCAAHFNTSEDAVRARIRLMRARERERMERETGAAQ